MIFSVLSVILYLIALGFSGWFALLSHKTGWQVLAGILAVAGAFVLVKSLWTVLSSVISRLRFYSGLRRRAEQSGMVYTRLHAPLASFFRVYAGADVLLQSSGRTLRIKFFPHFTKKYLVHIADAGHAVFSRQWALLFVARDASGTGFGRGRPLSEELMKRNKRISLALEDPGSDVPPKVQEQNIILISPTCYRMSCVRGNRWEIVDNDYAWVDGSVFWYQKDFFRFPDRQSGQEADGDRKEA